MSQQHINAYRTKLAKLHAVSGSLNEGVVSAAFGALLEAWGRSQDLTLVNQWEGKGPRGNAIRVDGALVPGVLRIPFGYWEAKDSKDDLDKEIAKKRASGYPTDNIIYEDTREAVLVQNGSIVDRAQIADDGQLLALLNRFFGFERPEIAEFRAAARQFKADLPQILDALRDALDSAEANNPAYVAAAAEFLAHAKTAINPSVSAEDVREMLIQHILTEEIFASVFDEPAYHRENNVAKRISALESIFFTKALRGATKEKLRPYYNAIKSAAADTADRNEKQKFVKNLYEDFYKVYNPKAADRLGVVYTPGEIVRFMIRGADWLCEQHFGKNLIDSGVEILDPATGTGTFIVELLEHFAGDRDKLRHKYKEELHANEVAILPYYVANLNIEATYAAITGQYAEFPGLVFVDTLDNTAGLGMFAGYQPDMFGSVSDENLGRIKRQNERKISVIIGNPPYNANQQNENDNNKNRTYARIDSRIKDTYIKASTAQKTKLYDMYARFLRWASDRLKDDGIIAFVSNSSFLHKNSFDGMRAVFEREFSELWVIDLKGDARSSGEARKRQGGNVFGDQIKVGIAIYFLVKRSNQKGFRVFHDAVGDNVSADDKAAFLDIDLSERRMTAIRPDTRHDWLGQASQPDSAMLPLADKRTKASETSGQDRAIFKLYSLGISTNRDDWLYDRDRATLTAKAKFLIAGYDAVAPKTVDFPDTIKWSETLKRRKGARQAEAFDSQLMRRAAYRPFNSLWLYQSELFIDRPGLADKLFPPTSENMAICFSDIGSRTDYCTLAINGIADLHFGAAVDAYQQVARYRYTKSGERIDNITDWALAQFRARYPAEGGGEVSKDAIFAYVYAVLHDPLYRTSYAADLRREFPRIPLYDDFARWAAWGQALLDLHIGYESQTPFALARVDVPDARGKPPLPKLKSLPIATGADTGVIVLDSETQLTGVPRAAWDYRLGNRSAIDWVLDQHKEKTPRDPTIAAKFNSYRFADHKDRVIDLLARVVTVSVATVAITEAMRALPR